MVGDLFIASLAMLFKSVILPRRQPPSAVINTRLSASSIRSARASTLNPHTLHYVPLQFLHRQAWRWQVPEFAAYKW